MSWYKKAFGEDYLKIYSHRTRSEAKRHVRFAEKALQLEHGARLLDLGGGYGRHAMEMARRGMVVTCYDLSSVLLELGTGHARRSSLNVQFIRGDMRHLPFKGVFDAVTSFFTSFGYFENDSSNERVIVEAAKILKPGGLFFLDYLNIRSTLASLKSRDSMRRQGLLVHQERSFDERSFRLEKKITVHDADSTRSYLESVRAYGIVEIGHFFSEAGLKCTAVYGDYDGSSFTAGSARLIMIGRKEE